MPRAKRGFAGHPIWSILREQGRYDLKWLARKTGYEHAYVRAIASGASPATTAFRAKCANVLDLPESILFQAETPTMVGVA